MTQFNWEAQDIMCISYENHNTFLKKKSTLQISHTQLQAVIVSISFKTILTQEIDNWQSDQTKFKEESPSLHSKIMVCKKVVHSLSPISSLTN